MRGLIWLLLLATFAVAIGLGLRHNDGYVLFILPPWRLEISLNLLIALVSILFVGLHVALRALALTFSLPGRVAGYRARQQRERGARLFQDAVRFLFEGRFGQALKKAAEAHQEKTAPALSALIAARAAQRLRDTDAQRQWLDRAKADDPRTEGATRMLEAEMMIESREYAEALSSLSKAQAVSGRHLAALRLELRARQGLGDWHGVLRLSRQIGKRNALPDEVIHEVRTQAHLALIAQSADDAPGLRQYLKTIPPAEFGRRTLLAAARALAGLALVGEAQQLIEDALENRKGQAGWQPDLIACYGQLEGGNVASRLARAEAWLPQHPRDAELLLALGRLCERQRLWGKAQSYFEASLSITPRRETHLALAALLDRLEKTDEANRHFRASAALDAD